MQEAAGCPPSLCNNSPIIDSIEFHELHEMGIPNDEGFRILYFENNGFQYTVDVTGGVFRASRPSHPTLEGGVGPNSLIGPNKALVLRRGVNTYKVRFLEVASGIPYYPAGSGTTKSYKLTWWKVGTPQDYQPNVCSDPPGTNEDTMGIPPQHMVFFEGDRINGATKRVYDSAETNPDTRYWFNFGCATHVLSKMHITHHTFASRTPVYAPTRDERQAQLKMYVADYCGTGDVFTEQGEDLVWGDNQGYLDFYLPPVEFEARWTAYGASCLEKPRIGGATPNFPFGVDIAIDMKCGSKRPPKCKDLDFTHFEGAHLISATP